ncbi:MAG TPA: glycerate kinase [Verrucomicrobiae bacterium]
MHVLIVPDKFKGTLSAEGACTAIAQGWRTVRGKDELELLPMSDGGDGFGEVMARLIQAQSRLVSTCDAAHRSIRAQWWWHPIRKLALIESARVIGLAMLPPKKFHPFQLDTFGLGQVFKAAVRRGAQHCVIGIGGSATNDAGFGLARALGWKFLNQQGQSLEQWWQLVQLHRVIPPKARLALDVTVAVDVQNSLLGKNGCSPVFGPQKGLTARDVAYAESCLDRLNCVLERQHGIESARMPGAGAAGGLGFGLMAFMGAKPQMGFDVFAEAAGLARRIRRSGLVITGEGALDKQSAMGKGVGQIARLCQKLKVPCVAFAGAIEAHGFGNLFRETRALTEITSLPAAKAEPQRYLRQLASSMAADWSDYACAHLSIRG